MTNKQEPVDPSTVKVELPKSGPWEPSAAVDQLKNMARHMKRNSNAAARESCTASEKVEDLIRKDHPDSDFFVVVGTPFTDSTDLQVSQGNAMAQRICGTVGFGKSVYYDILPHLAATLSPSRWDRLKLAFQVLIGHPGSAAMRKRRNSR